MNQVMNINLSLQDGWDKLHFLHHNPLYCLPLLWIDQKHKTLPLIDWLTICVLHFVCRMRKYCLSIFLDLVPKWILHLESSIPWTFKSKIMTQYLDNLTSYLHNVILSFQAKNGSITSVRMLNSLDYMVAAGTTSGLVCVFQMPSILPGRVKQVCFLFIHYIKSLLTPSFCQKVHLPWYWNSFIGLLSDKVVL